MITEPKELSKKISPIIKSKLYLADDELHLSCIEFLEWAAIFDEDRAFQDSFQQLPNIKIIDNLRILVEKKYHQARNKYITPT